MANYRSVHVKIWSDPDFEKFTSNSKCLFIYLITNAHRNESALYPITTRKMSYETNLSQEQIKASLAEMAKPAKVLYDYDTEFVWVVNAIKYQALNDNCVKSILGDLERCKSEKLKTQFVHYYSNYKGLQTHLETVNNGFINPPIEIGIELGLGLEIELGLEENAEKNENEEKLDELPQAKPELEVDNLAFQKFWEIYPRKVAKQTAEKSFKSLKISKTPGLLDAIIKSIERYKKTSSWQTPEYIPHPATFLNQKRWLDEVQLNQTRGKNDTNPKYDYQTASNANKFTVISSS